MIASTNPFGPVNPPHDARIFISTALFFCWCFGNLFAAFKVKSQTAGLIMILTMIGLLVLELVLWLAVPRIPW
jgi:hypothetical protein